MIVDQWIVYATWDNSAPTVHGPFPERRVADGWAMEHLEHFDALVSWTALPIDTVELPK